MGRLRSLVINTLKEKNRASIYVEVDAAKFDGSAFKRIGFNSVGWSAPEYSVYSTYLHDIVDGYSENNTIDENNDLKVFDCGKLKFLMRQSIKRDA